MVGPRKLSINGELTSVDVPNGTPLLWTIREEAGLTGTKFGCGMGLCGACTVHLDGVAIRSCVTPIEACAEAAKITTIEGLARGAAHAAGAAANKSATPTNAPAGTEALNGIARALIDAWVRHNVPQCGYCQSGQLMSAASLLARHPAPTDADIDQAMAGNICRCGTYQRMRTAIVDAAAEVRAHSAGQKT